jgi:hypothetical protein
MWQHDGEAEAVFEDWTASIMPSKSLMTSPGRQGSR